MLPGGKDDSDDGGKNEELTEEQKQQLQKQYQEAEGDKQELSLNREESSWDGRTETKKTTTEDESAIPKVEEHHKNLISPQVINEEASQLRFGEDHIRTIFINQWNDRPEVGFLEEMLMGTNVVNDVSLHISPYRAEEAEKELEEDVKKARRIVEGDDGSRFAQREKKKEYQQTLDLYKAFSNSDAKLFDVSMYITIRGDSEAELEEGTDEIMKALRSNPAFCKPEVPKRNQLKAFQSVNPVIDDQLGYSNRMLGAAIGTMYPFSTTSFIEKDGVDMGIHAGNDSPVIVNRFEGRNTGYNQLTFGKIGSGKSFASKLEIMRIYAARDDIKIVMLDPLEGFTSVNLALDGHQIQVGGTLGLNPLEIHHIPPEKRDSQSDPYTLTKQKVMSFFDRYYRSRGTELSEIQNGRGVLETAVDKAYENNRIYPNDLDSHKNDSPTVLDVKEVLTVISEEPEAVIDSDSPTLINKYEDAASELLISFSQFEKGGEYHNLAKENEVEIENHDVNYIDLQQRESSGKTGLMMHLLLHEVYEEAQRTDKKMLFAIDEAHMLLKNADSLDYLEHVVRHSRHYDLSINFITQNIQDFFQNQQTKDIAQLCSIMRMHRTEVGVDPNSEMAEALGLGAKELNFIKNATPGGDHGYSDALIGISEEGFVPAYVIASDLEEQVIDFDVKKTQQEFERLVQTVEEEQQGGNPTDVQM